MAITKLNSLAIPDDTIVEADLSYPLTNFSSTGIDDNASSTAVTIDSSQRVGIGTNSPTATSKVNIVGGNAGNLLVDNGGEQYTQILLQRGSTANTGGDILIDGTASEMKIRSLLAGDMIFATGPTAGGAVERMRVDADGIVKLITANDTAGTTKRLTFGTNAFNRAEIRCTNAATYDGSLEFHTGNSSNYLERARIHASGTTTIGTTEASIYDSNGGSDVQSFYRLGVSGFSTNGKLSLGSNSDGGSISGARINSAGDHIISGLIQIVSTNNTAGSETGDIRFYTKPSGSAAYQNERMRILSSGGITFNGDTATANALDDYEEGTWTIAAGASIGTISTQRSRLYTKIGRLVNIRIEFAVPSNSNGSQAFFTGLPFNSSNLDVYRDVGAAATTGLSLVTYQLNNSSDFYIYSDSFGAISFAQLSGKTVTCNFTYLAS